MQASLGIAAEVKGQLSGSFSVTSGGGAAYQVPISVPPGIGQVAPKLALVYSSQGNNGQLGVGWALSGLSFISRCGQTIAQDGKTTGVNYDANDRFCLAGQRIVNVGDDDVYYSDGATYHTELESWTSLVGHNENGSQCGSGPCFFSAKLSSGAQLEFGRSSDARILAQGAPGSTIFTTGEKAGSVRVWALNRYTDPSGNSIDFRYTDNPAQSDGSAVSGAAAKGAFYPARIDYTANASAGVAPQRSVQFFYESREDVEIAYQGQARTETAARLALIQTCLAGGAVNDPAGVVDRSCGEFNIINQYQLNYCDGDTDCNYNSTTRRSIISSIEQCEAGGDCLVPTDLDWQQGSNTTSFINDTPTGALQTSYAYCADSNGQLVWADFDGNGLQDFICDNASAQPALGTVRVLLNDGHQLNAPEGRPVTGEIAQDAACLNGVARWSDLNGDSLVDWLCNDLVTGAVKVLLSDGNGLVAPHGLPGGEIPGTNAACVSPGQMVWADFNGDSRTDWICSDPVAGTFWVMLSDGDNLVSINDPNSHDWRTASVQYQGRASCPNPQSVVWTDFNGDGMTDWICDDTNLSQISVFLSTGKSLISANSASSSGTLNTTSTLCAGASQGTAARIWTDFNGDHLSDWICNDYGAVGDIKVLLSTGAGLTSASNDTSGKLPIEASKSARCQSTAGTGDRQVAFTDFNGDEMLDWICNDVALGTAEVLLSTGRSMYPVAKPVTVPRCLSTGDTTQTFQWMDFNGDALADAVCNERQAVSPGVGRVWVATHDPAMPDLQIGITEGLGGRTEIAYQPLTNPDVYTRTASLYPLGQMLGYPDILVNLPNYVVAQYRLTNDPVRNAAAYNYVYNYHYEAGMIGLNGRGWLGFARSTMNDSQLTSQEAPDGVRLTSRYNQIYPFVGTTKEKVFCSIDDSTHHCRATEPHFVKYDTRYLCQNPDAENCDVNKTFQPYPGVYQRLKTEETQTNTSFGSILRKSYTYNAFGQLTRLKNEGDVGSGNAHPIYTCQNFANDISDQASWSVGLIRDTLVSSSSICPADETAWRSYRFNPTQDFSWQHTNYDATQKPVSVVSWDDTNNSWLGRGFGYDLELGNRNEITKVLGPTVESLQPVDNSAYDIAYETAYRTFPASLTTPEATPGQEGSRLTAQLAFDQRFGNRVGLIDLNNHVTTTCVDGFGRTLATQGPQQISDGATDTNCLSASTYTTLPSAFRSSPVVTLTSNTIITPQPGTLVLRQEQRDTWENPWASTQKLWTDSYFDGLQRSYRKEAPGETKPVASLTEYQGQKRVKRTSLPFFVDTPVSEIQWVERRYDAYGRPVSITAPYDGAAAVQAANAPCNSDDPKTTTTTCYSYSSPNTVIVTKAANSSVADQKQVQFEYFNSQKRPVTVTTDGTTAFSFDLTGRPIGVVDATGVRSEIAYDSLGRRIFMAEIDIGPRFFNYDAEGRLASRRDGLDTLIDYSYDGLNRVLNQDYIPEGSDGPVKTIAFTYDVAAGPDLINVQGRKASTALINHQSTEENSTYRFGYDAYGRMSTSDLEFEGTDHHTTLFYGPNGKVISSQLPDNNSSQLSFQFDAAGLLESVDLGTSDSGDAKTYLSFDNYTAAGQPGQMIFKSGVVEEYTYSQSGVLSQHVITSGDGNQEQLLSNAFAWDPLGQVTAIYDCNYVEQEAAVCNDIKGTLDQADNTQNFSYRSRRLTNAEGVYGTRSFDYDPGGNLLRRDGIEFTYASQRLNREGAPSHQVISSTDGMTAVYDGNGNLTEKTAPDGRWLMTYDPLNKLVAAHRDGIRTNEFVYDYAGRRLKKITYAEDGETVANSVTYISPLVQSTTFGADQYLQSTIYVPGLFGNAVALTSAADPAPAADFAPGVPVANTSVSLHRNLVASTVLTTDGEGAFAAQVDYTPYGEIYRIAPDVSADTFRPKFDGHERDSGTGIYNFGARYYDQSIARFRSADTQLGGSPLTQDAFNRYEINLSNPISLTDPTGNAGCGALGYTVASVGGFSIGALAGGAFGAGTGLVIGLVGDGDVNTDTGVGALSVGFLGAMGGVAAGAGLCNQIADNATSDQETIDRSLSRTTNREMLEEEKTRNRLYEREINAREERNRIAQRQVDATRSQTQEMRTANRLKKEEIEQQKRANDFNEAQDEEGEWDNLQGLFDDIDDCQSFTSETLVLSSDGRFVPISSISVGTPVLGFNENAHQKGEYRVSQTNSRSADSYYKATIGGEEIEVTAGHRFKLLNGGWVRADQLQPGAVIQTVNGTGSVYTKRERVEAPARVYSMTVPGARNYFVSEQGLLVHNCPFRPKSKPQELSGEAEVGEFAEEAGDIAGVAGEAGTDAAAIGEATAVAAEGATDLVEGAAAVAGGAEIGSDIVEGLVVLCAALCWL